MGQSLIHGAVSPASMLLGVGAAGANKFARERGSSLAATTANSLSKLFQSQGAGEFSKAVAPIWEQVKKGNPVAISTFQILSEINAPAVQALQSQDAMQRRKGE